MLVFWSRQELFSLENNQSQSKMSLRYYSLFGFLCACRTWVRSAVTCLPMSIVLHSNRSPFVPFLIHGSLCLRRLDSSVDADGLSIENWVFSGPKRLCPVYIGSTRLSVLPQSLQIWSDSPSVRDSMRGQMIPLLGDFSGEGLAMGGEGAQQSNSSAHSKAAQREMTKPLHSLFKILPQD